MTTQARINNGISNDQIRAIATQITGKVIQPLSMIKKEVFPLMTKTELIELKRIFLKQGGDPNAKNIQGITIPKAPVKAKTVKQAKQAKQAIKAKQASKVKIPLLVEDDFDFTNGIAPVQQVEQVAPVDQDEALTQHEKMTELMLQGLATGLASAVKTMASLQAQLNELNGNSPHDA